MKARAYRQTQPGTYEPSEAAEATHVMIHFPAPVGTMMLGCTLKGSRDALSTERGEPVWTWNGDSEKPTVRPSVLTEMPGVFRFHCWLGDGLAEVLGDCYGDGICAQKGEKVPVLEVLE